MQSNNHKFESEKDRLLLFGSAFILIVAGFFFAYQFVEPAPPKTIVLATGSPNGAYHAFGQLYAEALQKDGITVELKSTAGSQENLRLLQQDKVVDIAFVQGGISPPAKTPELLSLGSLYYEPLWLFLRQGVDIEGLHQLTDQRIAVGASGSGTRQIALQLLTENGITNDTAELLEMGSSKAVEALQSADIDAAFLVAGPKASTVQQLLKNPRITLFSFDRADAYLRHHSYLSRVDLPEGVIDFRQNLPPSSVTLLAPTANLVVRDDFHPALIGLLLQTADRLHAMGTVLNEPGRFPSDDPAGFVLDEDAKRYYKKGPSFLQRYLPFWAATLIDRLIVMIVPLLTLMIPLFKIVPPTYRWRVRRKIYRWYDQLRELDLESERADRHATSQLLMEQLNDVEHDVMKVAVPKSYMDAQYDLRLHIRLIRDRLERQLAQPEVAWDDEN